MAARSNILAWESLWTKEPGGLQSMGSQKSWTCLAIKQQQPVVKDTRLLKIAWTLRTKETGISLAVVKTPCFQHSGVGPTPDWGTKILHAPKAQPKNKNKKTSKRKEE